MLISAQLPANQDLRAASTAREVKKDTSKAMKSNFTRRRLENDSESDRDMRDDVVQRVCGPDDLIMHETFERDYGFVPTTPTGRTLEAKLLRPDSIAAKLSSKI